MPVPTTWTQSGAWFNYSDVNSGFIVSGLIGNQAVVSGSIGSGQIGQSHLGSGAVQSGQITSGNITTFARQLIDDTLPAGETISGPALAVMILSGNSLAVAMAGSGLRLPTIGIVLSGYISGTTNCQVILYGRTLVAGYSSGWSGAVGDSLFVGSGGNIITSGAFASGQFLVQIGVSVSGGLIVNPLIRGTTSGFALSGGILA